MKMLHTADVHLRAYGDERWETLQELIDVGQKEGIEILVISGDLFDGGADAEGLRPRIRHTFSHTGFKIVLIPGNHDMGAYRSGAWFGEDVVVLNDLRVPFACQNVRIWGMPFEPMEGEYLLHELRTLASHLTHDQHNILLYHGELLDAFFSRSDFGDEGDERYMPVRLSYFRDLNIDYVLAGHFHSKSNVWQLDNGGYFVYPGSPLSITRRETGQRKAIILEVGKPPSEFLLDTPHFDDVVVELDPLDDKRPVDRVKARLEGLHERAKVILTVDGYVNGRLMGMGEGELVAEIEEIATPRCVETHYEFRDIQVLLDDDLMKRFMQKLQKTGDNEDKKTRMRDMAIKALMASRR